MPDEKTHADALRIFLTGAATHVGAQADPDLCLGKHQSSTECTVMGNTVTSAIANVTIAYVAAANGAGAGSLNAPTADTLTWTPPGGSAGAAVTIANGETKILEGGAGETNKYIRVTRTSAVALTGTATVTIAEEFNNTTGFDNVSSAEAAAGDVEYRCICIENVSASEIQNIKAWVTTIGTQRVSAAAQLGASGAGTIGISAGDFSDWEDSGFCRIVTAAAALWEIVYYSSRTSTVLTVPAAGRAMLGTSAQAGTATDLVYSVPGIRIAKDAPASQPSGAFTDQTAAGEGAQPAGLTWRKGISASDADVIDIGDLDTLNIYALWIERNVIVGAAALASVLQDISIQFDSA